MFKIISAKEYRDLQQYKADLLQLLSENKVEQTYNCGYKSCQFQTTSPAGLKRHRTRIHKKK